MKSLRSLMHAPGLFRLLSVRLTSQLSDGAFQAALAFSILFNPDRHTDPLAIAGGFAVLLLPYSLLGPFAGALLDHWDRRRVLLWVNLLRAVAIVLVAVTMSTSSPDTVVLMCALLVTGCSRLVASGLSASLPLVSPPSLIVEVNSVFTTLGGGMLAAGAGVSGVLRLIFGADNGGSGATLLAGAVFAVIAALLAGGFAPRQLGPDRPDGLGHTAIYSLAHGLAHGMRAVLKAPSVGIALAAIGTHRLVFGVNTLMFLLLVRHTELGDALGANVRAITLIGGSVALGALIAAGTTPVSIRFIGRRGTIIGALLIGALAELGLLTLRPVPVLIAAAVVGLAGQTVKLCGDVAMQCDIFDTYRGQVFAVQDALFNTAFVAAIFFAALFVPADGFSVPLVIGCSVLYALTAAWVIREGQRAEGPVPPPLAEEPVATSR
ncbi:MFS transporter [Gordonia sp. (in: high G+C Gram-positive bacteria)]|uniref:MFS transporter n=1 Tax=Gordonia sp. (in: high G+C Gram-positive bacteria) TaxID=84139 RepID=UPI0025C67E3A|nr:MFS transporter [Gordonia sp. (in: high G+C Gram-positive bacteria)]